MEYRRRRNLVAYRHLLVALVVWLPVLTSAGPAPVQAQPAPTFSAPLGFRDGQTYAPHLLYDHNGNIVEDTRYGALNPDLEGMTCFGAGWEKVYHAGEDLYRTDGKGTEGAEVTAVADGQVVYANPYLNYPGRVIIIQHPLASGETIYSVYAHLDHNSVVVSVGEQVRRGQRLGTVMYQAYTGRFPELHPSRDDSHLHFELRRFLDGRKIYPSYPGCNGLIAGRGYTYPDRPGDFPAPGTGYLNPADYIK